MNDGNAKRQRGPSASEVYEAMAICPPQRGQARQPGAERRRRQPRSVAPGMVGSGTDALKGQGVTAQLPCPFRACKTNSTPTQGVAPSGKPELAVPWATAPCPYGTQELR